MFLARFLEIFSMFCVFVLFFLTPSLCAGCYQPHVDQKAGGVLWEHPELAGTDALRHRHSVTALSVPRRCVGLARRRMGRGGRSVPRQALTDHGTFSGISDASVRRLLQF